MEKKFKLPKDFALKWIEALRSGKYKQGKGELAIINSEEEATLQNTNFCCLGVAGHLCGNTILKLSTEQYLYNHFIDIPSEVIGLANVNPLVSALSRLNDGVYILEEFKSKYNLRELKINREGFTFLEIADFIEDNVEFY